MASDDRQPTHVSTTGHGSEALAAGRHKASAPRAGPGETHLYNSPGPHRNLLDCIKSRAPTAVPPEIGHHTTTTCDLVDLSARVGRPIKWDATTERCLGDDQANRLLTHAYRPPWRLT